MLPWASEGLSYFVRVAFLSKLKVTFGGNFVSDGSDHGHYASEISRDREEN
jgi:hypothetical protein